MNTKAIIGIVAWLVVLAGIGVMIPFVFIDDEPATTEEPTTTRNIPTKPVVPTTTKRTSAVAPDTTTTGSIVEADCVPFQDYFATKLFDDPIYLNMSIKDVWRYEEQGVSAYFLNVTTLNYLTEAESTFPTWWHRVLVLVPDVLDDARKDNVMFYNMGGSNRNDDGTSNPNASIDHNSSTNIEYAKIAQYTGTVSIVMRDNPNQPMFFKDDPTQLSRKEDAVIAYTWARYIDGECNGKDCIDWVMNMYMTKAITSTFSAVRDFLYSQENLDIEKYVISGQSKRGWTSWLSCSMDPRCIGSAPIVLDILKMRENLHFHYRALGGWSFAFTQYYHENLTMHLDSQEFEDMQCIFDPWDHMDRFVDKKIPIYHQGATGDEFFMLQDSLTYVDDARDNKGADLWIRYLHNAEHTLEGEGIWQNPHYMSLRLFYNAVINQNWEATLPKYSWQRSQNATHGQILVRVDSDHTPTAVKAFKAETVHTANPLNDKHMRDFRLARLGDNFTIRPQVILWNRESWADHVEKVSEKEWLVTFAMPEKPYLAFYAELEFELDGGMYRPADGDDNIWSVSTPPVIMPDTLPFDDCYAEGCYSKLV